MSERDLVHFLMRMRVVATTAKAIVAGVVHAALHPGGPAPVQLQPGDRAPEFELPGSDGRMYRLSDFAGKTVVLAWFPKAFTGGCTAECESIGASSRLLQQFPVVYFGANVDSPETNRQFAASIGIQFPILSDSGTTAARAYGVLGRSGFPSRWTFYIGGDGRVLAIDKDVTTSTHGTDIAQALSRLLIPRT
jgi:peroxiredoxin Q/BCP